MKENILTSLVQMAQETPEHKLFGDPERTVVEFLGDVCALATKLEALGVNHGDRVLLFAPTSYQWTLSDYAILMLGATTVPVYDSSSEYQLKNIISDCSPVLAIAGSAELFDKIQHVSARLPVLTISRGDLESGMVSRDQQKKLIESSLNIEPSHPASIVYTSGTSGTPKGCVLTHNNWVYTASQGVKTFPQIFNSSARTILFLPLAHAFAHLEQFMVVRSGTKTIHSSNPNQLTRIASSFKPTFLVLVPRVVEKIFESARQKANSPLKRKIFSLAYREALKSKGGFLRGFFDKLIYSKLRAAFGGELNSMISGGASLNPELTKFFKTSGIAIFEGYGLTETSAGGSITTPSHFEPGTVGKSIEGTDIKIAADGEILIKGPGVFKGYWGHPERKPEEWFHTGDQGAVKNGFLTITGRTKDIIVTAGGKNVAPDYLESHLRQHPLISQAVLAGEGKPFISALLTLDAENLSKWSHAHGLKLEEVWNSKALKEEIAKAFEAANALVSRAESVREWRLLKEDFTVENGLLTPSLKVKRKAVYDAYSKTIEEIYTPKITR